MRGREKVLCWIWVGVLVLLPAAFAQQGAITGIREVKALGIERAALEKRPVKLRGVVTSPSQAGTFFHVQSGDAAVSVKVPEPAMCPARGDEVEITGTTGGREDGENSQMWVDATAVAKLGAAPMPEARRATVPEMLRREFAGHWVEVEGVVLQAKVLNGSVYLHLLEDGELMIALVREWPESGRAAARAGTRLRLRGVSIRSEGCMIAFWPESVVVKDTVGDLFGMVASDSASLRRTGPSMERKRMRATVLHADGNEVWLRDGGGAFVMDFLRPWSLVDPTGVYLDPFVLPVLTRGDVVDLVGSPVATDPCLRMAYSRVRVTGERADPLPVRVEPDAIGAGRMACELASIRGRLRSKVESRMSDSRWRTVIGVEGDGGVVEAYVDAGGSGALAELKVDDRVEAAGIVVEEAGQPRLKLRNPGDARSLGIDPAASRVQWLRRAAFIVGAAVLAVGWILVLRRRLEHARELAAERAASEASVRELNATLEKRVHERTAELEQAREDLKLALENERELGELKGRFIAMVSHEFRTPLGIIMSAVELLRHYHDRLPDAQRINLHEDIFRSTQLMSELMEQVLVLGRVEAGKSGCRPAPMDLAQFGPRLVDEMRSATHGKCPFVWSAGEDLGGALADEALLRHIFSNLLANAAKYSEAGSEVSFEVRRESAWAVMRVADHGIGIPEEDQPRLFEAFHRAGNVGEIPGTGLGLVIVKRCAELHGGTVEVVSRAGEGTEFTVRLPLFPDEPPRGSSRSG